MTVLALRARWREACPLGRLLCVLGLLFCPLGRLLLGDGRLSTRLTGIVCALLGCRGAACRDFPPRLLLRLVVDPNREENIPPLFNFFRLLELRRDEDPEAYLFRCRLADFISAIPFALILSSPTSVPLIFTNHPCTVDDLSLPR